MAGGNIGHLMQAKLRGDILSYPVEDSVHIYRGSMVDVLTSSGYAVPAADTPNHKFVGFAEEEVDNTLTGHTAGGKAVRVRRKGIFRMAKEGGSVAITEIGTIVCASTAQGSAANQTCEALASSTNKPIVGTVVGVNTTDDYWWVAAWALGIENLTMTSYTATTTLASHATGSGADLIGVEENKGYGATPTVEDAFEALLVGHIDIPLGSFTLVDGTALLKQATTVPGYQVLNSKELTIGYPDDAAAAAIMFGGIAMPQDLDESAGFEVHFLVEKSGTNGAVTFDLTAFMAGVGDVNNADCVATTIITLTNLATTPQELVFSCPVSAGVVIAPPCTLNGIVDIVTAGTDHVNIHAAWIEYTKTLA